jgi:hypothetical protein
MPQTACNIATRDNPALLRCHPSSTTTASRLHMLLRFSIVRLTYCHEEHHSGRHGLAIRYKTVHPSSIVLATAVKLSRMAQRSGEGM